MSQPLAKLCPNPKENLTEDQIKFLSSKPIPKNAEYVFSKEAIRQWSTARVYAWKKRETNPDAYYYRFVDPNIFQTNGGFNDKEHNAFMKQMQEFTEKGHLGHSWGMFSLRVPNKAGYQCSAYHRSLILKRKITDPSFSIINGKLVMVDKTRKVKHVPSYLSDAWRDPEVRKIVKQIDCWVSEFHDSLVPKDVQGLIKLPKTKASNPASLESKTTTLFSKQNLHPEDFALLDSHIASIQIPEKKDNSAIPDLKKTIKDVTPESLQVTSLVEPNNCTTILIDNTPELNICDSLLQASLEERRSSDSNDGINPILKCKMQDPDDNSSFIDICDDSSDDFEAPIMPTFAFQSFFTSKTKIHARPEPSMHSKAINPCIKKRKRDQKDLSHFWKGVKPAYIEGPDPDIIRIPDVVPPTWANLIRPLSYLDSASAANMLKVRDMFSLKIHDLKSFSPAKPISLEGVLVDPPWPEKSTESIIPLLYALLEEVCSLIHSGFVFIWVPKHLQYEMFKLFSGLGMRYVENLVWCQIALNNCFVTTSSEIICQSKLILLIFKKGDEIEIRHQRTADVLFDFIKPEAHWTEKNLSCPKPLAVYDMIETLLPNSQTTDNQQPWCLLELWAKETDFTPPRPNWIQVHQLLLDN